MFTPNYRITDQLLANIKRITTLVEQLNNRRFSKVITVEFERTAREVSSFASTSIEGNPLPLTEVKKVLKSKPENIRDSEREVLNYNKALLELGLRLKSKNIELSLRLILDIHKKIVEGLLPRDETGKLRQKGVIVNDPATGKVVYIPPEADEANTLVLNLIDFINTNQDRIDPLILAGIFHKQMVVIHPFMDGNGRTTRLATKVLLAKMGLDTFNLFSFENYYNQNVTKYFQTVGEYGDYNDLYTKIDFTNWLEYFTGGIIDELLRVVKLLPETGISPDIRLESYQKQVLKFIRLNGFISDRDYAKLTKRARSTRAKDLKQLTEHGIIERKNKGKATYYVLREG